MASIPRLSDAAQELFDAVVAISSDLDLPRMLDRIVVSACQLTGAQYGALGVIGEDGSLEEFLHHGIAAERAEAIGDLPHGRGILGLLITDPTSIRLPRLQDHPASYGFPPGHPPMTTFLGVPVRIRGTVFGNLYLTDKADADAFTSEDQELVEALATVAGAVIENARAYERSERQRAWLGAGAQLHDSIRPPISNERALELIVIGTRTAASALGAGAVIDRGDTWSLEVTDGPRADLLPGICDRLTDKLALAVKGEPVPPLEQPDGSAVLVAPMTGHLFGTAALVVLLPSLPSARTEQVLLQSFADQAALSLDQIQAIADREELAVVSDRDRIARDLHDVVIQRLFATGLMLQGAQSAAERPDVRDRLERAVADLDATIRDIRATIFELRHPHQAGLRAAIRELAADHRTALGFEPTIRTAGPIDSAVPAEIGGHLLAVLREALANVARHAGATRTDLEVALDAGWITLRVTDNGRGLPTHRSESGLQNARRRAQDHGGEFLIGDHEPNGTRLEWRVPLPE